MTVCWRRLGCLCMALVLLAGCGGKGPETESGFGENSASPAAAETEMRGVWVSFLELAELLNTADPAEARARLEALMDTCRAQGLNTVFWHARAHSDAFYPSGAFPAAEVAAPLLAAGFDPLACAVEAAHARGLALHAWVNPYRIGEDESRAVENVSRFSKNGCWYYDPASPQTRRLVLAGVREILERYAVDGIHFDDYFYPAGMATTAESFEVVPAAMSVADWRRAQVDGLVSAVYGLCRGRGRLFGISPAARLSYCRDSLYADVALWLCQPGYVDYLCPQIYYGFENSAGAFDEVLAEWLALPRHEGAAVYAGLALYKAGLAEDAYAGDGKTEWAEHRDILARQLAALRRQGARGFVLFRYAQLTAADEAVAAEREAFFAALFSEKK